LLGDVSQDALLESEFVDEYQQWIMGETGTPPGTWFDKPVRSVVTQKQFVVQDDANVWRSVLGMRVSDCGSGAIVDSQGRMVGIFT